MSDDTSMIPSLSGQVGAFITEFTRAYPPAVPPADLPRLYLPFLGGEAVLRQDAEDAVVSLLTSSRDDAALTALLPASGSPEAPLFLGTLGGMACLAFDLLQGATLPAGCGPVGLRALYGQLPEAQFGLVGYASQVVRFHRESRFCPVDGTPTEPEPGTWAAQCPACGLTRYPPVSPAVLILVHDGADRILLARKPGWGTRCSILAGFVEPGETLEECCWREAREEAGVETVDFVYRGSQPWPFPHQLMVGFFCRAATEDIVLDEAELEHAGWYRFDALPELPPSLSLSRQLIDAWVASRQG